MPASAGWAEADCQNKTWLLTTTTDEVPWVNRGFSTRRCFRRHPTRQGHRLRGFQRFGQPAPPLQPAAEAAEVKGWDYAVCGALANSVHSLSLLPRGQSLHQAPVFSCLVDISLGRDERLHSDDSSDSTAEVFDGLRRHKRLHCKSSTYSVGTTSRLRDTESFLPMCVPYDISNYNKHLVC
ncbi:hypothetical protein BDZ89DRAFT_1069620 [Hymenopellis radicata]|nr:hypothetical protein BDZ89DRAFT_1069620 [Hymenopellis radicata]